MKCELISKHVIGRLNIKVLKIKQKTITKANCLTCLITIKLKLNKLIHFNNLYLKTIRRSIFKVLMIRLDQIKIKLYFDKGNLTLNVIM